MTTTGRTVHRPKRGSEGVVPRFAGRDLHLLFLPALYVTWFRIKEPRVQADAPALVHGS